MTKTMLRLGVGALSLLGACAPEADPSAQGAAAPVTAARAVASAPDADGVRAYWVFVDGRAALLRGRTLREALGRGASPVPERLVATGGADGAQLTIAGDDGDDTVWDHLNAIGIGGGGR